MWEEIFNLAVKNGLWAALFTGLLIFVMRDSSKREKKYQDIIEELSENFQIVKDIKQNVDEIKTMFFKKKSDENQKVADKESKE